MEKLYKVTFTYKGHTFSTELIADSIQDAIELARAGMIDFGENWEAVLIAVDGKPLRF